jgi:hypothetical protein
MASKGFKRTCTFFGALGYFSQYRILYFFHGRNVAIVAHAIIKEGSAVPDVDIDRAIERQLLFVADPETHTYEEENPDVENE